VFETGNPAMGMILAASPHRVFISRVGQVDVYQRIPAAGGKSPVSGTTPTGLVQRRKCAIGDEADIPATQRFFVQGPHAQGDRHLNASRLRFISEKLLGLLERTTWPVVTADTAARTAGQGPKLDISTRTRGMWRC
jgi:hypothetical protein